MKKITDEHVMVLHDGQSGKYMPCLYDKNGNFIQEGRIEWTGGVKEYPGRSYFGSEVFIYFNGYETLEKTVMIN